MNRIISLSEPLEPRTMLSANAARLTDSGTLFVQGSAGNDFISVTARNGKIYVGAAFLGSRDAIHAIVGFTADELQVFNPADVQRIHIDGAAGNDNIAIGSGVDRRALLRGQAGNDRLMGEISQRDTLDGGAGDDTLISGSSRNIRAGKNDTVIETGPGNNTTIGAAEDVIGSVLMGGDGADKLTATIFDTVSGGAGSDRLQVYTNTLPLSRPPTIDSTAISSWDRIIDTMFRQKPVGVEDRTTVAIFIGS